MAKLKILFAWFPFKFSPSFISYPKESPSSQKALASQKLHLKKQNKIEIKQIL